MTIHHATRTRAEKHGIILEEVEGGVVATNHNYGIKVGPVAKAQDALMSCILRIEQRQKAEYEGTDLHEQHQVAEMAESLNATIEEQVPVPNTTKIERINGIPVNGAVAYSEGIAAADCPYSSETEDDEEYANFERWNEEWDAAADEASDSEESKGGSVVNEKYRAKYAEMGHPEHCGDWLAEIFNNLVKTKEGTDVGRVDAIAEANGVDNSKYDRTRPGWQGRLRMTTRNLLARVIWLNDGVFRVPGTEEEGIVEYRATGEWMANQRFKKPKVKEQAAPESDELEGPEPQA